MAISLGLATDLERLPSSAKQLPLLFGAETLRECILPPIVEGYWLLTGPGGGGSRMPCAPEGATGIKKNCGGLSDENGRGLFHMAIHVFA
jgi:hypothetical protein